MKTEIFSMAPDNIDGDIIEYCGGKIRSGRLVCFPTETVYGLGANAFDKDAVEKIFTAKGRPQDNPLIVHVAGYEMADAITKDREESFMLRRLGERFWPGPLTIISKKNEKIPDSVTCGLSSVGVRFPANRIALALIKSSGVPIAAPSANISGKPSPTKAAHVIADLCGKVDVIIDGGACTVGVESTVLDITEYPPCILRPGAITREDLESIITDVSEFSWSKDVKKPRSPGMKYRHYSPKAVVTLYAGEENAVADKINEEAEKSKKSGLMPGVLASDQTLCYYINNITLSLGSRDNPFEQASRLYECLRKFDELKVDVVFAEALPAKGVGDAIMNRLYRAAGGRLVCVEEKKV